MCPRIPSALLVGLAAVLVAAGCSRPAYRDADAAQEGPTISGRIDDPYGLRPDAAVLTLGTGDDGRFSSRPVRTRPDGRFLTAPVWPGTYVLRLMRQADSAGSRDTAVGLTVVTVKTADVTGVTLTVQRDVTITGQYRMESDNPAARWPPHLHVVGSLVVNGAALFDGFGSQGAPGGRFVLRNPLGPRVLRTGYSLEPGNPWWPSRVLLNGKDVTNVPTDFSRHEGSKLEVVFTQHPARLAGTVEDASGQRVPGAWVVTCAADATPCTSWANTTHITRADAKGAFESAVVPGRYAVRAYAPAAFSSRRDAERQLTQQAAGATPAHVEDRGVARLRLVMR